MIEPIEQPRIVDPHDESVCDTKQEYGGAYDEDFEDDDDDNEDIPLEPT